MVVVSAGAAATQLLASTPSADSESLAGIVPQPSPDFSPDLTTADIMVETLIAWGATYCFGVVGDGINSIIEALRKRQDRIEYIGVRHEEAAAFMASGFAKHTGQLGVCVGTTGPGAVHLLNGLYDANMDGAPVVAIPGMTFHDLIGRTSRISTPTNAAMRVQVSSPRNQIASPAWPTLSMSNPSSVEPGRDAEFDASVSLSSNAGNRVLKAEGWRPDRFAQQGERTIPRAYDVGRGAEPPRRNKFVGSPRWRSAMNAGLYDGPRWDGTSLRKQRFLRIPRRKTNGLILQVCIQGCERRHGAA